MTEQDRANFLIYAFDNAAHDFEALGPDDMQLQEFRNWSGCTEHSPLENIFKFFVVGMNFVLINSGK